MRISLLAGVDGGGTGCRVRVRRLDGTLIGEAAGGPANIFTGAETASASIRAVALEALCQGGLGEEALLCCHAGLGLAGANVPAVAARFAAAPPVFASQALESDALTACRGAFAGADGAIAILGTGTAYAVRRQGRFTLLAGWGMAVSDGGSGADLGRSVLREALLAADGIHPRTGLVAAVLDRFADDPSRIAEFALQASPAAYGTFAPLVWDFAERGDPVAVAIVGEGLARVEPLLARLLDLGAPRIALLGGLAARYRPQLSPALAERIAEPVGDAMEGALDLARSTLRAEAAA